MKRIIRPVALGTVGITLAVAALNGYAQSDPNQELQRRVEELEQKVRILERNVEIDQEAAAAKAKENAKVTAGPEGWTIKSSDDAFKLHVGGDIQVDSRAYEGTRLSSPPGTQSPDAFLIRRARPIIDATLYGKFDFRLMPDFGLGKSVLFDAYIEARFSPLFKLRAGKFKSPFGLEQLQSDDYLLFPERSLASDLVPNRDVGFQVSGDIFAGTLNYTVGVFNGVVDAANGDTDTNSGKDVEARVFASPFKNIDVNALRGLGLGVAVTSGRQTGVPSTTSAVNLPTFVTPGQEAFFAYSIGAFASDTRKRLSPQFYYYWGPFGILGEYVVDIEDVIRGGAAQAIENKAWNLTAGWILTGEDASFNGVIPRHPFRADGDGWGAFQIAGRVSKLEIDDAAFSGPATTRLADPAASAREARDTGAALDWYLNDFVKVQVSYDYTRFKGGAATGDREAEKVLISRFQVSF